MVHDAHVHNDHAPGMPPPRTPAPTSERDRRTVGWGGGGKEGGGSGGEGGRHGGKEGGREEARAGEGGGGVREMEGEREEADG